MSEKQVYLSRLYILYKFLTNLWFVAAVWLFFYRLFITDQQVGILDGSTFAIGLLAEVPSGALADRFGKDKLVKIGQLLSGGGFIIQALGSSFTAFFIGQIILMIGIAFVSGADDALFFEQLKFSEKSKEWRRLVMKGSQAGLVAALTATLLGGLLHSIEPRLPWILNGCAFALSIIVVWSLRDTRPKRERHRVKDELKHYVKDIGGGFREYKKQKLRPYVLYILAVQGLFYTTGYGLLRIILLDRYTFSPFQGAAAIALSGLLTIFLLSYMHKNAERISEKHTLTIIAIVAMSGLLLSLADIGLYGFIVILSLYAGEHVLYPFMSEVINNQASDDKRATVLSVASFLKALPYVVLAPTIGYLSTANKLDYFLVIWSLIIFVALFIYLKAKKKDSRIDFREEVSL